MKVYDKQGLFLCNTEDTEEYEDLEENGVLMPDKKVTKHHDAKPAVPAKIKRYVGTVYFSDGTSYTPQKENDPHIKPTEDGLFEWIPLDDDRTYFGMDIATDVLEEEQPEKPEWDETEEVLIYHPYSKDEKYSIEQKIKQREFLEQAPQYLEETKKLHEEYANGTNQLSNLHSEMIDLNLMIAESIGIKDEGRTETDVKFDNVQNDINGLAMSNEDITLLLAEMVGVE